MKNYLLVLIALVLVYAAYNLGITSRAPAVEEARISTSTSAIATTTPSVVVPAATTPTKSVVTSSPAIVNGVYQIYYYSTGFSPKSLVIAAGKSVRFVNRSNTAMRVVTSETKPTTAQYAFSQSKTVGAGGTYNYTFTDLGSFFYMNQNLPKHTGAITVVAQ